MTFSAMITLKTPSSGVVPYPIMYGYSWRKTNFAQEEGEEEGEGEGVKEEGENPLLWRRGYLIVIDCYYCCCYYYDYHYNFFSFLFFLFFSIPLFFFQIFPSLLEVL